MSHVHIFDTTLRDGTQGESVQLSISEKIHVAHLLDDLGVSYIEGGWPGSNPRDEGFFTEAKKETFKHSKLTAFGATRRAGTPCDHDPSLQSLIAAEVPSVAIFGKSSPFQVKEILRISPEHNLELIFETVQWLKARVDELVYDAEHFFDGYAEDPEYAIKCLQAAADGGADFLALCDTNGGTMPWDVEEITRKMGERFDVALGIHAHNDSECGVANALAAVRGGATMVQGTINGYGERCGNTNLVSVIPALELKMGHTALLPGKLSELTHVARSFDEIINVIPEGRQPYVGRSAFAHKAGMHVNAVMKTPTSYEHVTPESVGNARRILISDLSGRSNLEYKAKELGVDLQDGAETREALNRIKELENEGYQFEEAEASLHLLLAQARGERPRFFRVLEADVNAVIVDGLRPQDARIANTRAVLRLAFGDHEASNVSHGNGPVNALGKAMHRILCEYYPEVANVRLTDYKVRIVNTSDGTAAAVRVIIRATDGEHDWGTVGVSRNVVEASWAAMIDSYEYLLLRDKVPVLNAPAAQ